jgi:putative transposase
MRTTNVLERLHEEINCRTRVARLFPNEESLLRLVSAIEMEISEDWPAGKLIGASTSVVLQRVKY